MSATGEAIKNDEYEVEHDDEQGEDDDGEHGEDDDGKHGEDDDGEHGEYDVEMRLVILPSVADNGTSILSFVNFLSVLRKNNGYHMFPILEHNS